MISKVGATHLQRRAVVYLRQSSLKQVVEHSESTRRQYALRERALGLGWPAQSIDVVDDDLGRSGRSTDGRSGFQRLSEGVAQGQIGAVFALDVSRFARSSADWHRLLDLCGLADVVIADEQAIYDPRDHNDRLLLGIKGTMSEAELGWMRLRLRGARLAKARRGDHFLAPPIGYQWDEAIGRLRLDPDEQVQEAIRLILERFRIERSAYAVARYLIVNELMIPKRSPGKHGELGWAQPRPSRVLQILTNPTYAGAYVFGRREQTIGLKNGKVVRRHARIAVDGWKILHRDHHPAYISWEEFLKNQKLLQDNRPRRDCPDRHGAPMKGEALLQGIVLCGQCGHRMSAAYGGKKRHARYSCANPIKQGTKARTCWSVAARMIDAQIAQMVLSAMQPAEIELSLAVVREADRQTKTLEGQWQMSLERARYEARLAERRYKAVDPDNRVVARTLESDWESKLEQLRELEARFEQARTLKRVELSQDDRSRILKLTRSLPRVWAANTTTMSERKNLVRILIREVCLTPLKGTSMGTRVDVLWCTGAISTVNIERQLPGVHTDLRTKALLRELVEQGATAIDVAATLNERRLTTAYGKRWTNIAVHAYCRHHRIEWPRRMPSSIRRPDQRGDGLFSKHGVAKKLGVTVNAVTYWVQRGWLRPAENSGGARGVPCWFRLDELTIRRLKRVRDVHTRAASRKKLQAL
jgi:DNA invertase Pin-like site-specific DNA recombinase